LDAKETDPVPDIDIKTSVIESSRAPEPVGLYPQARRVGGLLFLSGVGPRDRGTKKIPGV
jgi:2-aminomuconate deaminase